MSETREELDGPFFECFGHDGVVRVCAAAVRDVPRLVPGEIVLVHEDTHELRNRYGRMGVVELEDNLLGKSVDVVVAGHVLLHRTLDAGRYEEVLLL